MATMKKTDLEFHFLSVELSPVVKPRKTSRHLVGIDLVCPRSTVARKSSSRTVTLESGIFAPKAPAWTDSVVFKEGVEGRFGIEVTLTEEVTDAMADYFVKNAAGALVKLFAGYMGGAVAINGLDDMAEIPMATLSKTMLKDKSPEVIFRGCVDLHPGDDYSKGVVVDIPLLATRDVALSATRAGKSGATARKVAVKKGESAGVCKIEVRLLQ